MKFVTVFYESLSVFLFVATILGCDPSDRQMGNSNEIAGKQNEGKFATKEEKARAQFIANAVACNFAEIKLAQLARSKSHNPGIKEVAKVLEGDQLEALDTLKAFAWMNDISIPDEEKEDTKATINDLMETNGLDFDEKWSEKLVQLHEEKIREYKRMEKRSDDAALTKWINGRLPKLEAHLKELISCRSQLRK
jgi:putative membrane protein